MESSEGIVLEYNRLAMELLKVSKYRDSLDYLKTAQQITSKIQEKDLKYKLMGIILNNYACLYKRKKQFKVALQCLNKAVSLQRKYGFDSVNSASTYLNRSAIYSCLKNHQKAFQNAKTALSLLQLVQEKTNQQMTTLVISYFNAGSQLEYLNRIQEAVHYYSTGWNTASRSLGNQHPLAHSLQQAFYQATGRFNSIQGFTNERQIRRELSRVSPHVVGRSFIERKISHKKYSQTKLPVIKNVQKRYHSTKRSSSPYRNLSFRIPYPNI